MHDVKLGGSSRKTDSIIPICWREMEKIEGIRRIDEAIQRQELPATTSANEPNLQERTEDAVIQVIGMLHILSKKQQVI